MADFSDIPGELFNQRIQGLQNRYQGVQDMFADPNSYARGRLGLSNQEEDEEEKRRRLAAQAAARGESAPVKETRTTDPATGEVKVKIEGNESDLTAANPNTPTVVRPGQPAVGAGYTGSALTPQFNFAQPTMAAPAGPVAPAQDPAEMARARAAQEQAMQAQAAQAQAMQAQAAQAQAAQAQAAQAQAQAQAMPAPAQAQTVAAPAQPVQPVPLPNAAPPQQGQPIRDDSGQIVGYETNNQMMKNMLSGAPVGANAPAVPVNPNQAPPAQQQPVETATVQQTAEPAAATWQDKLLAAQKDPDQLIDFIANKKENSPEAIKIAQGLLKKAYKREEEDAALEKSLKGLASKDPKEQADSIKKLRSKDEEGSLFKAYIFNRLGLTQLAQEEQSKISGPKVERIMLDGKSYMAETNRKGGFTAAYDETGRAVDDGLLAKLNAGASKFGSQAYGFTGGSMTIPDGDPDAGQEYRQRTNAQTGQIENIITTGKNRGKVYGGAPGSEKRVNTQQQIEINRIMAKIGTQPLEIAQKIVSEEEAKNGPMDPKIKQEILNNARANSEMYSKEIKTPAPASASPQQKMSAPAVDQGGMMTTGLNQDSGGFIQTAAPGYPGARESERALNRKAAEEDIEVAGTGKKEIAKEAGKQVAASPEMQSLIKNITRAQEILDSGKHNIGSLGSALVGRGPIAQMIGEQAETTDAKNTKTIMDTINKLAVDGLKVLGANPSTADLKFWTENKPNASTDPEYMKEWIASRKEDLESRLQYARKQNKTGGQSDIANPATPPKTTNTIDGRTYEYDGKGWKAVR
jgi:hypothetical protein